MNFSLRKKEKEENIWRREIFFANEKTNGEGKVGKYFVCRGEEKRRRKGRKIFG